MYRQGDILLIPVAAVPAAGKKLARVGGRVILAEGEATGHAHAIAEPGASLFESGEAVPFEPVWQRPGPGRVRTFLRAERTVALRHEEHAPIIVPAGLYEVRRQRLFDPTRGAINVLD